MRKLFLVAAVSLLFTACVHRQYYKDVIGNTTEKEVSFVLKNAKNGEPLAGVPIRVSAGNERVNVTTDGQGHFTLPVKKSLMDPYTVIEVMRPKGVEQYTIERAVLMPSQPPPTSAVTPADGRASSLGG